MEIGIFLLQKSIKATISYTVVDFLLDSTYWGEQPTGRLDSDGEVGEWDDIGGRPPKLPQWGEGGGQNPGTSECQYNNRLVVSC